MRALSLNCSNKARVGPYVSLPTGKKPVIGEDLARTARDYEHTAAGALGSSSSAGGNGYTQVVPAPQQYMGIMMHLGSFLFLFWGVLV